MGDDWRMQFEAFVEERTREAASARIDRLSTILDRRYDATVRGVGNEWVREHYDGDFDIFEQPTGAVAMSVVFVQSKDHNTVTPNPAILGGGATDKHFLYEGLSRVAADGIIVGAGTLDRHAFYSVWHPEIVALRESLGLPRHPAQIVVSRRGDVDFDAPLFNVPDVPVFLVVGDEFVARHAAALAERPWLRQMHLAGSDLRPAIDRLRIEHGIRRLSSIGGRATATHLVDEGLVQDLYLTTTSRVAGEPGTPWYAGARQLKLEVITRKQWVDAGSTILFEHILIH